MALGETISRSQLYTAALEQLLDAEPKDDVTRAYDSSFSDDEPDAFIRAAGRRALANIEWEDE